MPVRLLATKRRSRAVFVAATRRLVSVMLVVAAKLEEALQIRFRALFLAKLGSALFMLLLRPPEYARPLVVLVIELLQIRATTASPWRGWSRQAVGTRQTGRDRYVGGA